MTPLCSQLSFWEMAKIKLIPLQGSIDFIERVCDATKPLRIGRYVKAAETQRQNNLIFKAERHIISQWHAKVWFQNGKVSFLVRGSQCL